MSAVRTCFVVAGFTMLLGMANAQGGLGMGPGMGPAAASSGAGMGPGLQGRRGPGASAGSDFTPGWAMMTAEERSAHRARMASMQSYDDCRAYVDKTHEEMASRAKAKGGNPLPAPRRDACAGLRH